MINQNLPTLRKPRASSGVSRSWKGKFRPRTKKSGIHGTWQNASHDRGNRCSACLNRQHLPYRRWCMLSTKRFLAKPRPHLGITKEVHKGPRHWKSDDPVRRHEQYRKLLGAALETNLGELQLYSKKPHWRVCTRDRVEDRDIDCRHQNETRSTSNTERVFCFP